MGNESSRKRSRIRVGRALDSRLVYATATVIIMLLLSLFYVVLLINMGAVDEKTAELKQHPYAVTVAAGHAETLLMQVRTLDDRLAFARSPATLASVKSQFAVIDGELREALGIVANRYRGDSVQASALLKDYDALCEQQRRLVELSMGDVGDETVAMFLANDINPRIDKMLAGNTAILEASSRSFDQLYGTVSDTRDKAVTISTVLMVAVVVVLAFFFVVIERKNRLQNELQLNLESALEKAQDASLAKSRFLSRVSHDIRTPLTAIIGITDIASGHVSEPERIKQSLEKVQLSSHHLLNLVNDVLDMSKIENGQINLAHMPFDVRCVAETSASIVRPQAETKGLRFEVGRIDLRDGSVLGDEMRVSQILINLLGNSVKYTEPGGVVTLDVEEIDSGENWLLPCDDARVRTIRFVVEDDGIGMSKEFQLRMFDPFEREDVSGSAAAEGTGLGMSIVKNLVDLMGGSIDVESQCGHGTRFTLTLPFEVCDDNVFDRSCERGSASEPSGVRAAVERSGEADEDAQIDWSDVHVLLAEDNLIVGEVAEEFIRSTGATLDRAWNGSEAIDLFQAAAENDYDLVFMDIQMPCMDGLEAARAISQWCERTGCARPPIIAMTANAYVEDRRRALAAGMDGFAVKPIGENEIRRLFQSYIVAKTASPGG